MVNEAEKDKIANINTNVMILKRSFTANSHTAIHGVVTKTYDAINNYDSMSTASGF